MDTKSHNWREVGLAKQLSARAVKRARIEFILLFPALAATLLVYGYRDELFGDELDLPVRIGDSHRARHPRLGARAHGRQGDRPGAVPAPRSRHRWHRRLPPAAA